MKPPAVMVPPRLRLTPSRHSRREIFSIGASATIPALPSRSNPRATGPTANPSFPRLCRAARRYEAHRTGTDTTPNDDLFNRAWEG